MTDWLTPEEKPGMVTDPATVRRMMRQHVTEIPPGSIPADRIEPSTVANQILQTKAGKAKWVDVFMPTWTTLLQVQTFDGGSSGAQWMTGNGPLAVAGNAWGLDFPSIYFDSSDYRVEGKVLQGRVIVVIMGNTVAQGITKDIHFTSIVSTSGAPGGNVIVSPSSSIANYTGIPSGTGLRMFKGSPVDVTYLIPCAAAFNLYNSAVGAAGSACLIQAAFQLRHV